MKTKRKKLDGREIIYEVVVKCPHCGYMANAYALNKTTLGELAKMALLNKEKPKEGEKRET